jgi:hypothetical protein
MTSKKKTVKAGSYAVVFNDKSDIHNFNLSGPDGALRE